MASDSQTQLKDGIVMFNPSLFTVKLGNSNYSQWRDDVTDLFFANDLLEYIDGTGVPPTNPLPPTATAAEQAAATKWEKQDHLLRFALAASMSANVRPYMGSARTARAVWLAAEQVLGSKNCTRVVALR